jgi:hypothetical protein
MRARLDTEDTFERIAKGSVVSQSVQEVSWTSQVGTEAVRGNGTRESEP